MRVISGTAGGRKLQAPDGIKTRPTTDKVKEAIFSSIQFAVPGSAVLDLFAGSGQMGIECLSRGAKKAVFVDIDRNAVKTIKQNLQECGFDGNYRVINATAKEFLDCDMDMFDIIFLDPPYRMGILDEIMEKVYQICYKGGIIIAESEKGWTTGSDIPDLRLQKVYRYGKIQVTKFIRE